MGISLIFQYTVFGDSLYISNILDLGLFNAPMGTFNAFLGVNIAIGLIPGLVALLGFIIWVLFYPLTGEVVDEMKGELSKIHEERRFKYLKELEESKANESD